jgi:carboxyl-terminal processing protease
MNDPVPTKNLNKLSLALLGCGVAAALALIPSAALAGQTAAKSASNGSQTQPAAAGLHNKDDQTEANIARTTAELLEAWHYSQHPFDQEISSKFLDRCLSLDYDHMFFLQSDLDEFEAYRTTLGVLTLKKRDLTPCHVIFSRFLERMAQRTAYATNLLLTEQFDFNGHERFNPVRHTLPSPKDMAEAKELWREDLRYRYLEEKLKAPNIQFAGAAVPDGAGTVTISLKRDKAHPLGFDLLPQNLLDEKGRSIGSVQVSENLSNAVVHLQVPADAPLKKFTNNIFSSTGTRLGNITFQREVSETGPSAAATPNASLKGQTGGNPPVVETTQMKKTETATLQGVIELDQKNMADVLKNLTNYYATVLKNYNDLTNEHYVLEWYLNSLAHAYDPHSDYMGAASSENFAIQMNLSLFGIGARLMLDGDYCKIEELVPEGPASKSGQLKAGDRIIEVAQHGQEAVNVIGMPLQKVVDMIRGPKATEVTLTILRTDADDSSVRKKITLVRDEIRLEDQRAKAKLYETPAAEGADAQRIGVIDLSSFYGSMDRGEQVHEIKSTTMDVIKLIDRLKKEKVSGIILDLRRNGGGFLEEAIKLTGLFITKGPVVQTKEFNGDIVVESDTDPSVQWDGPLIVLTSRFSASASEILAGALQDYGRALIIGDKSSFGKGTVQTMQSLAPFLEQKGRSFSYNPGSLKVTIKKFYRAGGASTQLNGVVPDIVLASRLNDDPDVGESALPNALPWDDVTSADFQKCNMVAPYQPELLKLSLARQEKEKDFAYVREDIEEYKKWLADKSVSMNEADRLMEQKQKDARAEARKKERTSRKKANEKVYEITLKNYDKPGLEPFGAKAHALAGVSKENLDDDSDAASEDLGAVDSLFTDDDIRLTETRRIMGDYVSLLRTAISQAHNGLANPITGP